MENGGLSVSKTKTIICQTHDSIHTDFFKSNYQQEVEPKKGYKRLNKRSILSKHKSKSHSLNATHYQKISLAMQNSFYNDSSYFRFF